MFRSFLVVVRTLFWSGLFVALVAFVAPAVAVTFEALFLLVLLRRLPLWRLW